MILQSIYRCYVVSKTCYQKQYVQIETMLYHQCDTLITQCFWKEIHVKEQTILAELHN